MTSGGQGEPFFRRYGRELVSKPAISFLKVGGATVERKCSNHCFGNDANFGNFTFCRRCRRQDTTEGSNIPPHNTTILQLLVCVVQPPSASTSSFGRVEER